MNALRLSELQELLRTATFVAWWVDFVRAGAAWKDAEARRGDLLYWRRQDDPKGAWGVPLAGDGNGAEVTAPPVYGLSVSRSGFLLEPAREDFAAASDGGERRFEELLIGLRRGPAR